MWRVWRMWLASFWLLGLASLRPWLSILDTTLTCVCFCFVLWQLLANTPYSNQCNRTVPVRRTDSTESLFTGMCWLEWTHLNSWAWQSSVVNKQGQTFRFSDFFVFSDFCCSNPFIFEPKVEKINMGVISTNFVPLISIKAPTIMEEWNHQLWKLWFLQILTFASQFI